MAKPVNIQVDESQFPDAVAQDLMHCFRTREINPKFLYTSYRQAEKWLRLHEAYSPARNDADCLATYDRAFERAAQLKDIQSLVGLGCGGGQKDARLAELLDAPYTPMDVSMPLVITAARRVKNSTHGVVCDLAAVRDLDTLLPTANARLLTFFGMIPNFEASVILTKLAAVLRNSDRLLMSANLTPPGGIEQVLPQYANRLTEDWLMAFLHDYGIREGRIEWTIKDRICADFVFAREEKVMSFAFQPGEKLRLFFSFRYTPEQLHTTLAQYGLLVQEQWITASAEEGIFLCAKKP